MKIEVRVPTLSDSVASGTLLAWRKAAGDAVARDETLIDLETDKVILEIPAPASGVLAEIIGAEGASVKADEVIAVIETEGAGVGVEPVVAAPSLQPSPARGESVDVPPGATQQSPASARSAPSPLRGEGWGEGEVLAQTATQAAMPPSPPPSPARGEGVGTLPTSPHPASAVAATRREPLSRLRRRIAERLVEAQHTAAMLTTFNEVNMAPVNDLRQRMKAEFEVKYGVKLGYMSFFVRAVCAAMREFPVINAAIDGDDIVWRDDVDIGIAVSTPRGLVVPILRRCQTLAAADIEAAIADFGRRAKEGKLALEELAGGTFSITNGGVFGSLLSTPILNPPQSAILGMHAIQDRPIAEHGQVVIRPMMYLALTYDHRLVDGRDAVQFLVAVKRALEAPAALLDAANA